MRKNPTGSDFSKQEFSFHVILTEDIKKRSKSLAEELEEMNFKIQYSTKDNGIIEIPPHASILWLNLNDLGTKTKNLELKNKINDFIKTSILRKINIAVIFEGYNRMGKKKKEILQNIIINNLIIENNVFQGFIPTENSKDTAYCIKSIAKREQMEDKPPVLSRVKSKAKYLSQAQEFFIEGLLNCGKKKAKELLQKFDSPLNIIDAILKDPAKISDIYGFGEIFLNLNEKLLSKRII